MIFNRNLWVVCCDKCHKTLQIKAASEILARKEAERQRWVSSSNSDSIFCPNCVKKLIREEQP